MTAPTLREAVELRVQQIRDTAIRVKPTYVFMFQAGLPSSAADLKVIAPADLEWLCQAALAAHPAPAPEPGRCTCGLPGCSDEPDTLSDRAEMDRTSGVLAELAVERRRQAVKHGDQSHLPDGTGPNRKMRFPVESAGCHTLYPRNVETATWAKHRCKAVSQNEGGDGSITFEHILTEEWAEAIAEDDQAKLRAELVQVGAVAVMWIEAIDKRADPPSVPARSDTADDWMLRCDTCGRDYPAHEELRGTGAVGIAEARRRAALDGWTHHEHFDYCPDCTPAAPVPSRAPEDEREALAQALRLAGVEVGYVGAGEFRRTVADRLIAAGWRSPTEVAARCAEASARVTEEIAEAERAAFSDEEFEESAIAAVQEGEWSWFRWLAVAAARAATKAVLDG